MATPVIKSMYRTAVNGAASSYINLPAGTLKAGDLFLVVTTFNRVDYPTAGAALVSGFSNYTIAVNRGPKVGQYVTGDIVTAEKAAANASAVLQVPIYYYDEQITGTGMTVTAITEILVISGDFKNISSVKSSCSTFSTSFPYL